MTYMYRNIVVLHDIEKTTSCYQHIMPFLVFYTIHWTVRGTEGAKQYGFYNPELITLDLSTILEFYGTFFAYYFLIFVPVFVTILAVFWDRIEKHKSL